jgi:hypothetical protein
MGVSGHAVVNGGGGRGGRGFSVMVISSGGFKNSGCHRFAEGFVTLLNSVWCQRCHNS